MDLGDVLKRAILEERGIDIDEEAEAIYSIVVKIQQCLEDSTLCRGVIALCLFLDEAIKHSETDSADLTFIKPLVDQLLKNIKIAQREKDG